MSFNAIRENKVLAKISESTVVCSNRITVVLIRMCVCSTKQGHWRDVLNDDPDLKACIGGPVPSASTVAGLGVLALVSTPDRRQSKPFLTVSERG